MATQNTLITASDVNTLVTLANSTLAKYGYSTVIPSKNVGDIINNEVYSNLVAGLTTINANAYCSTPVSVTDLDDYSTGNYIYATLVNLLTTKYNTVNAGYCTCNCNDCSCNCDRCSCNCDNCCNTKCTCNCDKKTWHCTISSQHTCFSKGQMIYTSRGVIPIEEVSEGDFLYNPYIVGFNEVTAVWTISDKIQQMIHICGQGFDILVTSNHPLPLYNKTTNEIEVIQPYDVSTSLTTDYMALFPIPQIKGNRYHEYNTDINVDPDFLRIVPYLVLFYEHDGFKCTSDKLLSRIIDMLGEFIDGLKYEVTINGIHIYRNEENIIEGRPIHDIFEMASKHGIPNWIYDFDKKSIRSMLYEFEYIFDHIDFSIPNNLRYQLRLAYALFNKEFSIKDCRIYDRANLDDMFLLIPITNTNFTDINIPVYNVVTKNPTHSCLVDIISLDGYNNGHLE